MSRGSPIGSVTASTSGRGGSRVGAIAFTSGAADGFAGVPMQGITAPSIGGFIVSIEDNGTLEFLVNFTKS